MLFLDWYLVSGGVKAHNALITTGTTLDFTFQIYLICFLMLWYYVWLVGQKLLVSQKLTGPTGSQLCPQFYLVRLPIRTSKLLAPAWHRCLYTLSLLFGYDVCCPWLHPAPSYYVLLCVNPHHLPSVICRVSESWMLTRAFYALWGL